jgi:hypothetical protein
MNALSIEIPASDLAGIGYGGERMTTDGLITAGTDYPSKDGSRLLTHIIGIYAYYIQTSVLSGEQWKVGTVYKQEVWAFGSDVGRGNTISTLKRQLAGTKSVITNFLDIYLGCLTVAGGPLAWSITGMQIVVAGGKIKQNYDLYQDALSAFVDDDMALRKMMPIFYDHMFVELFLARIEADVSAKDGRIDRDMAGLGVRKFRGAERDPGIHSPAGKAENIAEQGDQAEFA